VHSEDTRSIPSYQELLDRKDGPPGSAWGVFGVNDQLGSANFMTPQSIRGALDSVRLCQVYNLDYPVNAFRPPVSKGRPAAQHHIFSRHHDHRDDYLDSFYLQGTSQIDGLRHRRHPQHGFYNSVDDLDIHEDSAALGIGAWAEVGLVGRGVLLDVGGFLHSKGEPVDYEVASSISVELLEDVAAYEGVTFLPGDVLLLRTGWCNYYLNEGSDSFRATFTQAPRSIGLAQSHEMLGWLWDHRFVMVAADNVAVEVVPPVLDSPFASPNDGGLMHPNLIALLGFALGELWDLELLADACALDGVYECAVVAKPLNVRAGVGSPANALAIR
jgi:hypothetical protein